MEHTRFIGLDIHKERISGAVAESGRSGAVEYLGEIANEPGAISKLCDRLRRPGKPLADLIRLRSVVRQTRMSIFNALGPQWPSQIGSKIAYTWRK